MKRVRKYTEFGLEVVNFCNKHGITKEELAEAAGVRYSTLIGAGVDRAAGHQLIPTVRQYMADFERQKEGTA